MCLLRLTRGNDDWGAGDSASSRGPTIRRSSRLIKSERVLWSGGMLCFGRGRGGGGGWVPASAGTTIGGRGWGSRGGR